jgi:hypothetical protein
VTHPDGLLRMCIAVMAPEPVWFVTGKDGNCHWPPATLRPYVTVIDVRGGLAAHAGVKVTVGNGEIMIDCDGEAVIYERVGTTLNGHWVCRRQLDGNGR